MTGATVYDLIFDAADFLRTAAPDVINLDKKASPSCGKTVDDAYGVPQFYIGVSGLKGSDEELSDYEAMIPIIGLFHEVCGHGGQLKYEFSKATDVSKILAVNHYACKSSGIYYDGNALEGDFTKQYASQPSEIAAQYMALKSARSYLPRVFGEDRTDELLLTYVNGRINTGSEFIIGKYSNMDDVLNAFDKQFCKCADKHRKYSYTDDPLGPIMNRVREHKCDSRCGITLNQAMFVGVCPSGFKQDLMMCASFLADHPRNERHFEKPVFKNMDLSLQSVFSLMPEKHGSKPKVTRPALDRMYDMIRDIDRSEAFRQSSVSGIRSKSISNDVV